jgi:histidine ammonia-lyase
MGPIAAHKLLRAVEGLEHVLALEARMALEGVRLVGLAPAAGLAPLVERLSRACPPWKDRPMAPEIEACRRALRNA